MFKKIMVPVDLAHLPTHLDAIMPANGSKVARHTSASVFLIRPDV